MELKSATELKRYVPTDIANFRSLFLIGIIVNILSDKLGLAKSNGANQVNSICERDILNELDESGYTCLERTNELRNCARLEVECARVGYNGLERVQPFCQFENHQSRFDTEGNGQWVTR